MPLNICRSPAVRAILLIPSMSTRAGIWTLAEQAVRIRHISSVSRLTDLHKYYLTLHQCTSVKQFKVALKIHLLTDYYFDNRRS